MQRRYRLRHVLAFSTLMAAVGYFGSYAVAWAQGVPPAAAATDEVAPADEPTPAVAKAAEPSPSDAAAPLDPDPLETREPNGDVPDPFAPLSSVPEAVAKDPAAELNRGETLLRLGSLDEAARALRAVIAAQPDHLLAHQRLRRAAIEAQRDDVLPGISARLVELYFAAGDVGAANRSLDEFIVLAPSHSERSRLEELLGRTGEAAEVDGLHLLSRARSLLGMFVILLIAFLMSNNRKKIRGRLVAWGLGLQMLFAVLILWTPPGRVLFDLTRLAIDRILRFTDDGAGFLFGNIYNGVAPGATNGPVMYVDGATGDVAGLGVMFAFHILPTIIFFGSLMAVLYHLGLVQKVVRGLAWLMTKTMGTSGAESLSAAGNIFVGQTEAPLVIKPYIADMTVSELMAVMTGGFATVAGGVLAAYVRFGIDAGHLLAASVMSAPAALVIAKIMYPETEKSKTAAGDMHDPEKETANVIDAAAGGASDGMRLALNVAAMLMAFIAIIALINWSLGQIGALVDFPQLSLKYIFGIVFAPLAWCMGVDTPDLLNFGNLLGTKLSLNEFVAFVDLGHLKSQMTPRSFTIATYALCGFANFSSIGIQIGGISGIAPQRRADLARIGLKAMFGGALASWLTACVAGMLL